MMALFLRSRSACPVEFAQTLKYYRNSAGHLVLASENRHTIGMVDIRTTLPLTSSSVICLVEVFRS